MKGTGNTNPGFDDLGRSPCSKMAKDKKMSCQERILERKQNRTEGVAAQPRPILQKVWTVQVWSYKTALWRGERCDSWLLSAPWAVAQNSEGIIEEGSEEALPVWRSESWDRGKSLTQLLRIHSIKNTASLGGQGQGQDGRKKGCRPPPGTLMKVLSGRHVLFVTKEEGWVRGQRSEPGGEAENHTGEFPGPETTWSLWTSKLIGMMTFSSFHCLPFWSRVSVSPLLCLTHHWTLGADNLLSTISTDGKEFCPRTDYAQSPIHT